MRAIILPFLFMLLSYGVWFFLGAEQRAIIWKTIRPHIFPILTFILLALIIFAIGLSGEIISLF